MSREAIQRLAEFVARTRAAKDLSFPEIKRRGGPAFSTVHDIENGAINVVPRPETLAKLARGLGVDYMDLMRLAGYVTPAEQGGKPDLTLLAGGQEGSNHAAAMVSGGQATQNEGKRPDISPTFREETEGRPTDDGISGKNVLEDWGEEVVPLPVYGSVGCGAPPDWSTDEPIDTIYVRASWAVGVDKVIRVRGRSMSGYGINDGDDLLVKYVNGGQLPSGKPIVLCVDGSFVAKMFRRDGAREFVEEYVLGEGPREVAFERAQVVGVVLRSVVTRMW